MNVDHWDKQKQQNAPKMFSFFVSIRYQKALISVLTVKELCSDVLSAGHFSRQSGALAQSCHPAFIYSQL